jgi:uncharacterized protein YhaN
LELTGMYFRRLDLIAFGHFSECRLDLSDKLPGFHLIYGDNQAGKSTTLRAIRGFLFGIEQQSRDTFLHTGKKLRVAAEVEGEGERLYAIRRKGRKDTLLDEAEAPIDEARLRRLMGGADEGLFDHLFGLDHESLRQGAHELLEGEGGAAETLFGAGMGAGSVRQLLGDLRSGAGELYTSKSRTKLINVQIKEVREARAAVNAASTSATHYTRQRDELEALGAKQRELTETRARLSKRKSLLERQLRVLPLLARRQQHLQALADLGDVPELPKDTERRRTEAERRLLEATQHRAHEEAEIERVEGRLAALSLHPELQQVDPQVIQDIDTGLGVHRKAMHDMPKREGELKSLRGEAQSLLRELGSELPLEQAGQLRLTATDEQRLQQLSFDKAQYESKLQDAASKVRRARTVLAKRKEEVAALPKSTDVSELRVAVARIQKQLGVEQRLEESRQRQAKAHKRFERARANLSGYVGTAAQLHSLTFPKPEAVREFEREFEQQEQRRRDLGQKLEQSEKVRADLGRQEAELSAVTEVPSRERLLELRAQRDESLQALTPETADQTSLSLLKDRIVLSDEYADRLADAAGRVASLGSVRARRRECELGAQRALEQLDALEADAKEFEGRWRRLWAPVHVEPGRPREMLEWLTDLRDCIKLSDQHDDVSAETRALEAQLSAALTDLSKQLEHAGQPARQLWEPTLASLMQRAESVLEAADASELVRRDLERRASLERDQFEEAEHEQRELIEREKAWRSEWHKALKAIELPRDSSPREVRVKLAKLSELMHKLTEIDKLEGRINGMLRDSSQLEETVRRISSRVLPDRDAFDLIGACEQLLSGYRQARADHEEAQRLREELERRSARVREAAVAEQLAREQLDQLLSLAGATDLDELRTLEELSERSRDLRELVAELEDQIVNLGEGASLDELISQTRDVDAEAAKLEIDEIEPELARVEQRLDGVRARLTGVEQELARLDAGAAFAAEELAERAAKLSASVSKYVRFRLASELLAREVERYREANQGPLMQRANALFPRLTRGAFGGVRVGFDDKDSQVLLCVKSDGGEVPIEGLSDGTLDQLYLALRLASLERYLEERPALPLVLDDVLIHFDDERARAALQVLGEYARRSQVLFFTHHRRMVELARAAISDDVLGLHTLTTATSAAVA